MTEEDEEFNRIERESRIRQETVRAALQKAHDENVRLRLYDEDAKEKKDDKNE